MAKGEAQASKRCRSCTEDVGTRLSDSGKQKSVERIVLSLRRKSQGERQVGRASSKQVVQR